MVQPTKWILAAVVGLGLLGAAWIFSPPGLARAEVTQLVSNDSERWSVGTYVEGPPNYQATTGRFLGTSAVVRSNRGANEMAFIFPASADGKTVAGAGFYILSLIGEYSGDAILSLRVYSYDGTLQRTVSASPVDLESVALGQWTLLQLSAVPADLVINPGEFLAFHVALSGAAGGNLDVRMLFDVVAQ